MCTVQQHFFIQRGTVLTSKEKAGQLFTVWPTGIHMISNIVIITFVIVKVTLLATRRARQNCRLLSCLNIPHLVTRLKSKAVAHLLGRGALKDLRDREGMAPIHLAVKAFDEEETCTLAAVSSLLDFGADIDAVDKSGLTALHWAIYTRKTKTSG